MAVYMDINIGDPEEYQRELAAWENGQEFFARYGQQVRRISHMQQQSVSQRPCSSARKACVALSSGATVYLHVLEPAPQTVQLCAVTAACVFVHQCNSADAVPAQDP